MKKNTIICVSIISTICDLFLLSNVAFAQNQQSAKLTFEGKSIVVEVPDAGQKCSVTYGQDPIITNLDGSTPTDLTTCNGSRQYKPSAGNITVPRDQGTGYWCFKGSKDAYSVTFPFENKTRGYKIWLANEKIDERGINVKDFGAKGDGATDDTDAIRNAIAFVAAKQGGTLYFPNGQFLVGGGADFKGLGLPSGITILGATSLPQGAIHNYFEQKQFSQIRVSKPNQSVFRIGECSTDIKLKNIALKATTNQKTYGIEAVGHTNGSPTNHVGLEDVSLEGFDIGFYLHNSDPNSPSWQFDIIRVEHCFFVYNRTAGIYMDTYNTDWHISASSFFLPPTNANDKADAIKIFRGGTILIENTFGGSVGALKGGTFIAADVVATLTVMNTSSERTSASFTYAQAAGTGGLSHPFTFINNIFGDPVKLGRGVFVSTGNFYGGKTVQTSDGTQIYSVGDRFCYDATQGYFPNNKPPFYPCADGMATGIGGFQGAGKIVFQTGQLKDVNSNAPNVTVAERPTIFGTETQFNAPLRLPSFRLANLPPNAQPASTVFCADCLKNTSPCKSGGNGALAISTGGQWDCK